MAKLLWTILVALMVLTACSNPAPTAGPQPEATISVGNQAAQTQPVDPTHESTVVTSPRPTEVPTTTPEPTEAVALAPTPKPQPTETVTPALTATPAPMPTPEPTTVAPSAPTPEPTPTATAAQPPTQLGPMWRGITVAPENRCSPYDSDDYRYLPSVEPRIVQAQGGIYGPYTGTWFDDIKETDIEHIVARSEAHDSGLCAASGTTRSEFASDLLNLTLASPNVNRHQKIANDAAEWLPELNQCWYVDRTVQVRREYRLTIDRAEADAIDRVLARCESIDMVMLAPGTSATATPTQTARTTPAPSTDVDALAQWDDNGNGRITCAEARAHGIAPVRRGHPAYEYMRDADGDGVVCE